MKRISLLLLLALVLVGCSSKPVVEPPKPVKPEPKRTEISFTVGGGSYTLPVAYEAFKEQGWELEEDPEYQIPANSYLEDVGIRQDKFYMRATFLNTGSEAISLKEGTIVQVMAEDRYVTQHYKDDFPPDILVEGKIKWRMTLDDMLAAFEEKPTIDENRVYRNYTYTYEDGQKIILQYHMEDDQLKYIILKDFGEGLNRD